MTTPAARRDATVPGARALVLLFLIVIITPGLGLALGVGRDTVSESEMRALAAWPDWSWRPDALVKWPAAFRDYLSDHFALRAALIDGRAALLWHGLSTSPSSTVIGGKNDWLFYGDDGGLRDWVQQEPFTESELADWRVTLLKRRAFLATRGIPFLFVIAPDKQEIYPEFMPDSLKRLRNDSRADQLIAYMKRTSPDFEILDLRQDLRAAKSSGLLYHHYDTHWNDRGALVAYQAIARALRRWFPHITPLTREDFDEDASVSSGDMTTLLGLRDRTKLATPGLVLRRGQGYHIVAPAHPDPYGEDPILVVEHRDQSLPTALVYRDSFGARLIPYLSEHFRHVEYYWQNELGYDDIERERPDIVIQEFVGRHFFTYGPYPAEIPQ